MLFSDLKLSPPILRALEIEGYKTATPIQAKAIPQVLLGHDVLGSAQTGTGKTAAFALPILEKIHANPTGHNERRRIRALILAPTRELVAQIAAGFKAYGREVQARYCVIYGGVGQGGQVMSLRSGVDVVVACPGRLLDLMNQGHVDLGGVETLVLDEADRMLDMGFIHDIKRICAKLPQKKQTLFFSATMPPEIKKLADSLLHKPVTVAVAPVSAVAERIDESVYFVKREQKSQLLAHLVKDLPMHRSIVFTRTKHGADKVVKKLEGYGIRCAAIHGNKSQNNRSRALHQFKEDKIGVLVATDIAARGIDVDGVTHVVNYDVTHEPETYVHRIGRTARAGASGKAISFCDHDETANLKAIERLIKRKIAVVATPLAELPAAQAEKFKMADRSDRPSRSHHREEAEERPAPRVFRDARGHAHSSRNGRPEGRAAAPAGARAAHPNARSAGHAPAAGKSAPGRPAHGKTHGGPSGRPANAAGPIRAYASQMPAGKAGQKQVGRGVGAAHPIHGVPTKGSSQGRRPQQANRHPQASRPSGHGRPARAH